jgi:hypothetical protein
MNRRSFLASVLAAGMAPAIVKAASLMPVSSGIWTPPRNFTLNVPGDFFVPCGMAQAVIIYKQKDGIVQWEYEKIHGSFPGAVTVGYFSENGFTLNLNPHGD